jgi:mRNA interferase MazF
VVILTRTDAIPVLARITVAPITRTLRRNRSQVPLAEDEGLTVPSVANCDAVLTVDKGRILSWAVGSLDYLKQLELDDALRFALAIRERPRETYT